MSESAFDEMCLFCRINSGEVAAAIVRQDEQTTAFRDVNPQAPVHILVIPRTHIPNAAGVGARVVWQSLMTAATAIAKAEHLDASGYRLVINAGSDAGQSVDHLHVHILGGRGLAWPPG